MHLTELLFKLKKTSSAFRGRSFFIAVLFVFAGCASSKPFIFDAVSLNKNSSFITAEQNSESRFLLYSGGIIDFNGDKIDLPKQAGSVKSLYLYNNTIFGIAEEGIVAAPVQTRKPLFIPAGKDHLAGKNIRSIRWHNTEKKLLVIYKSRTGAGFSECSLNFDNNTSFCKTFTTKNSGLLSNYVNQVEIDARGNIWLRYAESLELGVSKLTPHGEWDNYDDNNSQIGNSSVNLIRTEHKNEGHPGDNVWFVTRAGLSRLKFIKPKKKIIEEPENKENEETDTTDEEGESKITIRDYDAKVQKKNKKKVLTEKPGEKWIFYGDKSAGSNLIYQAMGIQSWFTDAIIGIVDLEILSDSLLIATKDTLYHYKGRSILRYKPKTVGGADIENIVISRIFYSNDHFFIKTRPQFNFNIVKTVEMFNTKEKTWHTLDFWHLKKNYPINITFTPFNKKSELVLLKYYDETLAAFMDYSDYKLKLIKIKAEDKNK